MSNSIACPGLFFCKQLSLVVTLVCQIDVQDKIKVQAGKFLKNINCAGQNRRAGGNFFLKINKRADQNKTVQGGFFPRN